MGGGGGLYLSSPRSPAGFVPIRPKEGKKIGAERESLRKSLLISGLVGAAAALYLKKVMISGQGCVPGESNNEAVRWGDEVVGTGVEIRRRERELG